METSVYGSVGSSSIRHGPGQDSPAPSRKRKDRDDGWPHPGPDGRQFLSIPIRLPPLAEQRPGKQLPAAVKQPGGPAPAPTPSVKPGGNRLLMAAYLAHEFLSRGTLFGRPYGTAGSAQTAGKGELKQRYEEVARIMWGGGAHVPGIINPAQLGGWLQKQQEYS